MVKNYRTINLLFLVAFIVSGCGLKFDSGAGNAATPNGTIIASGPLVPDLAGVTVTGNANIYYDSSAVTYTLQVAVASITDPGGGGLTVNLSSTAGTLVLGTFSPTAGTQNFAIPTSSPGVAFSAMTLTNGATLYIQASF